VTVSFCSAKPISFCAALEFLDEEGRAFKLPITGAVDNSLLTLQTFMQVGGNPEQEASLCWEHLDPSIRTQLLTSSEQNTVLWCIVGSLQCASAGLPKAPNHLIAARQFALF
jgi:hypothetical protein